MFDIGFSELMVVALVALIVIGPERLPRVARMAGHLLGRLQRYVSDVKADINREIQIEELQKAQRDIHDSVRSLDQAVRQELGSVESSITNSILPPAEATRSPAEPVAPAQPAPPVVLSDPVTAALAQDGQPQLNLGLAVDQSDKKRV